MAHKLLLFITVCMLSAAARSQISITGPACVLPGVVYQYLVSTPDTSGSGISICLTGGTFAPSGNTCLNDSLVSTFFVTWNTGASPAVVNFSSPSGTATKNITLTTPLQPGSIDGASTQQTIGDSTSPVAINCSAASGGQCSPAYSYQWQQSFDNLTWSNIGGATDQNFDVAVVVTQSCLLRRMVTETNSNSTAYSNAATITVTPNPIQQ